MVTGQLFPTEPLDSPASSALSLAYVNECRRLLTRVNARTDMAPVVNVEVSTRHPS